MKNHDATFKVESKLVPKLFLESDQRVAAVPRIHSQRKLIYFCSV